MTKYIAENGKLIRADSPQVKRAHASTPGDPYEGMELYNVEAIVLVKNIAASDADEAKEAVENELKKYGKTYLLFASKPK